MSSGVWSAESRPDEGLVQDVLPVEDIAVRSVVADFACVHARGAVGTSVAGIGGGDPDVERGEAMPKGPSKDVRGSEARAWYEARCLELSARVTRVGVIVDATGHGVVPPGGLRHTP